SRWVRQYREGGTQALRQVGRAGRSPKLGAAQLRQVERILLATRVAERTPANRGAASERTRLRRGRSPTGGAVYGRWTRRRTRRVAVLYYASMNCLGSNPDPIRWENRFCLKRHWAPGAVIVTICVALTLVYVHFVALRYADARFDDHQSIIQKKALSPYRYRVLLPWLAHLIGWAASRLEILPYRTAVSGLYVAFTWAGLTAGFLLFYRYMRSWFPMEGALLATLYLCALTPFSFMYIRFQPWGWWELAIFTAGTWLICEGRRLALLALIVAASFLRETAVFLAILYFVGRFGAEPPRCLIAWTAALGTSSTAVFLGLRMFLGWAPHVGQDQYENPLFFRLIYNLTHIMPLLTFIIFYNIFWIYSLRDVTIKPRRLVQMLWFIPVFLIVHIFSAHMNESRYYFEIAPIVMPLAMMSLCPGWKGDPRPQGGLLQDCP
ncbi:MAG: helix-turn-helix domain-containing protein, partial [Halothiobacillaceae bacterium]